MDQGITHTCVSSSDNYLKFPGDHMSLFYPEAKHGNDTFADTEKLCWNIQSISPTLSLLIKNKFKVAVRK